MQDIFEYEDDKEHFVGSHLDPFFDDIQKDVLSKLDRHISHGEIISGYENNKIKPKDNDLGYILKYPVNNIFNYLGVILGKVDEEIELISTFPFFDKGKIYTAKINKIYIWDNKYEAQINIDISCSSLNFYDPYYAINKKWYYENLLYNFQILGIAYQACYRKEEEIEIEIDEDNVIAFEGSKIGDIKTLSLRQMSSFIHTDEERDIYCFSGVIEKIEEIEIEMNRQKAWICSVIVIKDVSEENGNFELDILITSKIWNENNPPKKGDDIEGIVWIQGTLKEIVDENLC